MLEMKYLMHIITLGKIYVPTQSTYDEHLTL